MAPVSCAFVSTTDDGVSGTSRHGCMRLFNCGSVDFLATNLTNYQTKRCKKHLLFNFCSLFRLLTRKSADSTAMYRRSSIKNDYEPMFLTRQFFGDSWVLMKFHKIVTFIFQQNRLQIHIVTNFITSKIQICLA